MNQLNAMLQMGDCIDKAVNDSLVDEVAPCIEGKQRPNHVGIRIYYDTATYETLVESPAFKVRMNFSAKSNTKIQLTDIIYALGGQIGLWLGFSVITCIEFIGLAILIIMVFCQRVMGPSGLSSEERHKGVSVDVSALNTCSSNRTSISFPTNCTSTPRSTPMTSAPKSRTR